MSTWFASLQKVLPQHALSRAVAKLACSERAWVKSLFIQQFAKAYQVTLEEAQVTCLDEFASFNDFFTRALKADARPLADGEFTLVSPADGAVSQLGNIEADQLLQAKGHHYSLNSLAGSLGQGFEHGTFCTIYLAPSDYHRVHLPWAGELIETLAVPGELFSVNDSTAQSIPGLFCRNERLVCKFNTTHGPMLVILVGAMIVASIETVWAGPSSPYQSQILTTHKENYDKGDEIGRFLLGSTVICCFPKGRVALNADWHPGSKVRMGEKLGEYMT